MRLNFYMDNDCAVPSHNRQLVSLSAQLTLALERMLA
jgi:hypothetical protein